jgi:release factor glutamine methyltransferase
VTRGELTAELAAALGAPHEARFIVEDVCGRSGAGRDEVDQSSCGAARAAAARRIGGEPLQYVLGHWAFRTLDLLVDDRVLIPRPETEQVVEVALAQLGALGERTAPVALAAPCIVDAGTGSGAIVLSLAVELARTCPGARLWATDASAAALEVARANLARVRAGHRGTLPVSFVHGSWLEALPAELRCRIDLVVANPPYVAATEWEGLPGDVRCEPRQALVAADGSDGTPGLGDVEAVLTQAAGWLGPGGAVVVELAPHQAGPAATLAGALGYGDVRVSPDLAGRARALRGRWSQGSVP